MLLLTFLAREHTLFTLKHHQLYVPISQAYKTYNILCLYLKQHVLVSFFFFLEKEVSFNFLQLITSSDISIVGPLIAIKGRSSLVITKVNRYLSSQIMSLGIEVSGVFISVSMGVEFIPNGLRAEAYVEEVTNSWMNNDTEAQGLSLMKAISLPRQEGLRNKWQSGYQKSQGQSQ